MLCRLRAYGTSRTVGSCCRSFDAPGAKSPPQRPAQALWRGGGRTVPDGGKAILGRPVRHDRAASVGERSLTVQPGSRHRERVRRLLHWSQFSFGSLPQSVQELLVRRSSATETSTSFERLDSKHCLLVIDSIGAPWIVSQSNELQLDLKNQRLAGARLCRPLGWCKGRWRVPGRRCRRSSPWWQLKVF